MRLHAKRPRSRAGLFALALASLVLAAPGPGPDAARSGGPLASPDPSAPLRPDVLQLSIEWIPDGENQLLAVPPGGFRLTIRLETTPEGQ